MSEQSIQAHFTYSLANSEVRNWPFPHAYYEDVFPKDFYEDLVGSMPGPSAYKPIDDLGKVRRHDGGAAFPDRQVITLDENTENLNATWEIATRVIRSDKTMVTLLSKFFETVGPRLSDDIQYKMDAQLIKDRTNHTLGPHTDHSRRLVVLLIYLPKDDTSLDLGTSLYVPGGEYAGMAGGSGDHYNAEDFDRVFTAPFKPNSAVGFVKTDNSFHGVEPVPANAERDLIQCFVKEPGN
jgi:hypothetical protein